MRNSYLLIIFFCTVCLSCGRYVQVFECTSDNVSLKSNTFFYENDIVKISYNFWHQKGIMLFRVYNKLSVPIYIHWDKSHFSLNHVKGNYIKDSIPEPGLEYAPADSKISFGAVYVESKRYEGEAISEILPGSNFDRYVYLLYPAEYLRLKADAVKMVEVSYNNNTNKNTTIYTVEYDAEHSPIKFENQLQFFTTEGTPQNFSLKNNFYVSEIKEMKEHHCFQILKNQYNNLVQGDGNFRFIYTSKFEKPNTFYGYIPNKERIK